MAVIHQQQAILVVQSKIIPSLCLIIACAAVLLDLLPKSGRHFMAVIYSTAPCDQELRLLIL